MILHKTGLDKKKINLHLNNLEILNKGAFQAVVSQQEFSKVRGGTGLAASAAQLWASLCHILGLWVNFIVQIFVQQEALKPLAYITYKMGVHPYNAMILYFMAYSDIIS